MRSEPGTLQSSLEAFRIYSKTHNLTEVLEKALRCVHRIFTSWLWDIWHRVETRKMVPVSQLDIGNETAAQSSVHYAATDHRQLCAILADLNVPAEDFAFIDFGCGKGKALLIAARRPFARIIGIELSSKMAAISRHNITRYRFGAGFRSRIEIIEADAASFEFPRQCLLVFCHNPFGSRIMQAVLMNLKDSLDSHPRQTYLIYVVPRLHQMICQCGFLKVLDARIYREHAADDVRGYCIYGSSTDHIEGNRPAPSGEFSPRMQRSI
jgi:SAM-dependent methyltransferase